VADSGGLSGAAHPPKMEVNRDGVKLALRDYLSENVGVAAYLLLCVLVYINRVSQESHLLAQLEGTTKAAAADVEGSEAESDGGEAAAAGKKAAAGAKPPTFPTAGANVTKGKMGVSRKGAKANKGYGAKVAQKAHDILLLLMKPLLFLLERRLHYYGKLTWQEVEYLLWREGNTDGSYLVSESIKHQGYYELAVCLRGNVHHYLVRQFKKDGLFGIEDGLRYPDLYELVTHYHREADGLCCALVRNAWRKDGLELLQQMRKPQVTQRWEQPAKEPILA